MPELPGVPGVLGVLLAGLQPCSEPGVAQDLGVGVLAVLGVGVEKIERWELLLLEVASARRLAAGER